MLHPPLRLRRTRGFTLLEIMVVIVIVGIMATVTMLSFGILGRDREMEDQAERVWAVINQAREECELQGFDVGLRVGTASYEFLRFDPRQQLWEPIIDDDLLGARELPQGLRLRLWLEGREVVLKERLELEADDEKEHKVTLADKDKGAKTETDQDKKKEPPPHVMILSSGDINSFDLQFEREDSEARWHVFSRPDNTVAAEEVLEAI